MGHLLSEYTTSWLNDTSEGFSYTEFSIIKIGEGNVSRLVLVENKNDRDYIEIYKNGKDSPYGRDYNFDHVVFLKFR